VLARKSMVFEVLQDVNHLEKEMEHLTRLKHFHILQAFGSYLEFNNDRYAILLYPYCEYTLTRFMRECEIIAPGPTDPRELVSLNSDRMLMRLYLESFFPCLAQALRFIYSQTTRHMDIKPSNILVKKRPRGVREGRLFHLFIADFDISSTFTSFAKTGTKGLTRKTDKYCAPEVVPPSMPEGVPSKAEWGSRADVFSLGCVFAEMLTTIACRRLLDFDKYRRKDNRSSNFYETIPQALKWLTDLSVFKDDYKALGDQARLYWYRRGKYEAFELWHETFTTTVEITKEMLQKDQKLRPRVSELCPRLKTGDCCCGETLPVVEESFD
jgi:serine/threonine protein kinase